MDESPLTTPLQHYLKQQQKTLDKMAEFKNVYDRFVSLAKEMLTLQDELNILTAEELNAFIEFQKSGKLDL